MIEHFYINLLSYIIILISLIKLNVDFYKDGFTKRSWLFTILIFVVSTTYFIMLPSIFLWWKIFGYISYVILGIFSLLILCAAIIFNRDTNSIVEGFIVYSIVVLLSVQIMFIFIFIPTAFLPFFKKSEKEAQDTWQKFDVRFVDKSFENIRNSFDQVQKSISIETSVIDKSIADFQRILQTQEQRLGLLQKDLKTTQVEVERYKALANLTKEQQDALVRVIDKGKYVDYVVGFILGIVGSLLVEHFPKLFRLFQLGTAPPRRS